jgi:hypothetical protein
LFYLLGVNNEIYGTFKTGGTAYQHDYAIRVVYWPNMVYGGDTSVNSIADYSLHANPPVQVYDWRATNDTISKDYSLIASWIESLPKSSSLP